MWYTWDSIPFEIEHLVLTATPEYDSAGVDYIRTHFRSEVDCVFNPKATIDPSIVAHSPPAAETLTSLNVRLRSPRKVMSIIAPNHDIAVNGGAAIPVLQSPAGPNASGTDGTVVVADGRYLTDAKNGPIVIECRVDGFVGEKTANVHHVVETWLVECSAQRPYMSNRFSMRKTRDVDGWETRIIDGTAIFRSDLLYQTTRDAAGNLQQRYHPSQWAHELIPVCPFGFRRIPPDFHQHEDGVTFDYHVEDVQQPLGIKSQFQAAISRIEGEYIDDYTAATFPMAILNKASESMTKIGEMTPGMTERFFGWLPSVLTDIQNAFPSRVVTLNLTAYGTPQATKSDLLAAILKIANGYRLSSGGGTESFLTMAARYFLQDNRIAVDLWNRRVTLAISIRLPGAVGTVLSYLGIVNAPGSPTTLDEKLEEMEPIANKNQLGIAPSWTAPKGNQTEGIVPTPTAVPPPNTPCVLSARIDPRYMIVGDNLNLLYPPRSET